MVPDAQLMLVNMVNYHHYDSHYSGVIMDPK